MRLLSSLLVGTALLFAQSKTSPASDDESTPTFRSDTRLVILPVSVADSKGRLITNLTQQNFKVYENDAEQSIKIFKREDVPVSLGIIIDNSGSMREKSQEVEMAALDLVKASNPQDEVFIVNFNYEAYLDVELTNDLKKLKEGVARVDSYGRTALRDAVSMSIDYLKEKGNKEKKALLVVTDGNDNASTGTLEKLVDKSRQSEVLIFAVGLLDEEERGEAKKAKRALDAITHESGGLAFYPKKLNEVDRVARDVAYEIRSQYTIAYSPTVQTLDGSFRRIKVTVNGAGHPIARTRTGYYATPDKPGHKTVPAATNSLAPPSERADVGWQ